MGSKAPSAPSPAATASAQQGLNNVNQYTPMGSVTYQPTGSSIGGVPQYAQVTQLSPQQQQLYNSQMQQNMTLSGAENSLASQIAGNYGGQQSFQPGSAGSGTSTIPAQPTQSQAQGIAPLQGGSMQGGPMGQPTMQTQQVSPQDQSGQSMQAPPPWSNGSEGMSPAYDQYMFGNNGTNNYNPSTPGTQQALNPPGPPATFDPNAYYQNNGSGYPGSTGPQAPITGQPSAPGQSSSAQQAQGFSPVTGGLSPQQLQNWSGSFQGSAGPAAQTPAAFGIGGQIQNQLPNADLQGAFNQQQQAAYQNQMGYLQPQQQQASAQLQDQLRQQGITQESNPTAYANAMQLLNNNQTFQNQQAYNSSYQSGLAGANQMFGQGLQQGQFYNAAQQQGYGESANNASMANQVGMYNAGQANTMAQQNAQLNNSALNSQLAGYSQNAGLNNAANAQQYQNLYAAQNQPINQLNALRGNTQVSSPQSGLPTPPNYMGAAQTNYQNQLASYNNQQSGLFGLGSSALMGYYGYGGAGAAGAAGAGAAGGAAAGAGAAASGASLSSDVATFLAAAA